MQRMDMGQMGGAGVNGSKFDPGVSDSVIIIISGRGLLLLLLINYRTKVVTNLTVMMNQYQACPLKLIVNLSSSILCVVLLFYNTVWLTTIIIDCYKNNYSYYNVIN